MDIPSRPNAVSFAGRGSRRLIVPFDGYMDDEIRFGFEQPALMRWRRLDQCSP